MTVKSAGIRVRSEPLIQIQPPDNGPAGPSWQAFLELGFRPFYLMGCGWAILSVMIWVFWPEMVAGRLTGIAWHAHEMLWGFVASIAVGFLLTAAATWTGQASIHGWRLAALCVVWLTARIGFLGTGVFTFWVATIAESLFFVSAAWALARMIYGARSKRNYGVPWLVIGLALSNGVFLWQSVYGDYASLMHWFHIGLLLMAMISLLIGRRVIPFFAMRAVDGLQIPMRASSGRWQMALLPAALVLAVAEQSSYAGLAIALVAVIAVVQLLSWRPGAVLTRPLLWVLYAGYFGLAIGLLLAAAQFLGLISRGAWSVHVIGIGGFALLIIGMVTRTALGHTGRRLLADRAMTVSFALVIVSAFLRIGAVLPGEVSLVLLQGSALAWGAAFTIYLVRFIPILISRRQ